MAFTQDELKQQVAVAAVQYVKEGIIGVGTGSTANFFINEFFSNSRHDFFTC